MHNRKSQIAAFAVLLVAGLGATAAIAAQPLETETARLPAKGHGDVQFVYEYQTSSVGDESAIPLVLSYGLTDRLELAVEPVAYTSIKPKGAKSASGFGDTEVTLTYLIAPESGPRPAIAIAGEVKFPTTKNPLIGTGSTDYRIFGIVSKRVGRFDLHANLGYTVVGNSSGSAIQSSNIVDYAAALEFIATPTVSLFAEVLGNTSAGGSESTSGPAQEISGSSITGLVGVGYRPTDRSQISFGITYDSDQATLLRSGLALKF
jgi:hypothetical protein